MKECSDSSAVLTVVDNARNIYDSMVNKHDQLRENNYSKSHKVTQQHFSWIEESFQVLRQTNNFKIGPEYQANKIAVGKSVSLK